MRRRNGLSFGLLALTLSLGAGAEGLAAPNDPGPAKPLPAIPLSLEEIFARIDSTHPLLKGAGTEKIVARGQLLRALGAFEPSLVNDMELERFIPSGQTDTNTSGFNDVLLEARHPLGFRGSAGVRQVINGPAKIPDLGFNNGNNQVVLGAFIPLLRGLMVNPENAALQRSELADPRADLDIAQTRQDLFLAAASQFWEWVSAWKLTDVQQRALAVAEERFRQVEQRAKAGAAAPLDVVEANQEVQRRKEVHIAALRAFEQEQYKLSLFLWSKEAPVAPGHERVPDFPPLGSIPSEPMVLEHKRQAQIVRPEVRTVDLEAQANHIDLELAKNNLLPSLDAEAAPARSPEKFVLGLGYRFGVELRIPFLQRQARGEVLQAQGKADRLVLLRRYREQQVLVDVDNALSALQRAQERIDAARQSLQLAKTLVDGERFRFNLGATSVLFVNLRERNAVDSENQLIRARADYQKARALYDWAIGTWSQGSPTAIPATSRPRR